MQRPFSRLAIVNRGEPAMRVIHAVRELNAQRPEQICVIALYTEADRDAMFVRHADEAVALSGGYLDLGDLERALGEARADAAWVGWGFVAERPEFAELCERMGIVFVGPDAAVMRLVGDKIAAKRLAEEAGVPVAPWSGGPVETADEALRHAARIGFPLMIKATAGGGGRGIRRVDAPDALPAAFASAQAEAIQAFGDGTVLLEKLITPARHIEVQIVADGHGGAWAVGLRDCSYQRRNQKVIEESASPALTAEQEREVLDAARRLALRAGYRNAGTVEFLYEPATAHFSFMEVNARLQVEHPVTEAVTGLDLVKLQLDIAAGGRLEGEPPAPSGHAVEARLNAEDPALGFAPAPGRIALLRLPTGPGVRVDTGVAEGDVIPAEFDSMIAKIIAWGEDRDAALARLRRAMADTMVVVEGGTTNQGFLLELLDRPEVRTGEVDTTWLDRLHVDGEIVPMRHADVALLQAAIVLAEAATAADRAQFYALARRGRPEADGKLVRTVDLRHLGQTYRLAVAEIAPRRYRVMVDSEGIEVTVHRVGPHERRLQADGRAHRTLTSVQDADLVVEVDGVPHRIARDDGGLVRNLSPAVVVSIPVSVGDEVHAGDVVAVVEAMKMESSLTAPFDGRVRQVLVGANVHVAAQAPLLQLEPLDGGPPPASGERVAFASYPPRPTGAEAGGEQLRRLEWLVLGYDIAAAEVERIVADLHVGSADLLADPAIVAGEHRLLRMFADVRAVSRPRHDEADPETPWLRSPQEHLNAWLGSLDAEAEGLPDDFMALLRAALAHYGIDDLDRTPALEEACYRLHLAQDRAETVRAAAVAILDRRLEQAGQLAGHIGDEFREALDHLVAATDGRDAVVADLARDVRYRYFDEPVIAAAREGVYAEMAVHVAALAENPSRPDRDERLAALVACPRPLAALLTARMRAAEPALQRLLVEAMARRYYRVRALEGFELARIDDCELLMARYPFQGRRRHLAAAYVDLDDVGAVASAFARHAGTLPGDDLAVLDLYAEHSGVAPTRDELAARLREALAGISLPPALHRIVVAVAQPTRGRGMSAIDTFTFRHQHEGLVEDEVVRGLHPMMGHRLALWRLENFALERLVSAEDVYAFHGVAHANAKDERLFALAEVRDLTPVRDEDGRIVALPELERILVEVLETIRRFQARRAPSKRLQWNRIQLYVWPVVELTPEEINAVMQRLAPISLGLGIEHVLVRRAPARIRRHGARAGAALLHPRRRGRRRRARRSVDRAAAAARRDRAADRRGAAPRRPAPRRDRPAARARARHRRSSGGRRSSSTTSTTTAPWCPSTARPATNEAGIVVGTIRNVTERYPEGMVRVILLGDPTRALGSLAEPECRRIIAALDLAEELGVPLEWFALSAGAKIAMDSGTENMDWIAAVLRRIVAVHPGRRRDQRRRHRHQRRRPAVLERRGDDAHAHARDPRHDARERDGADRQAGARLLGRRLGRGQLRHRRLRAHHGPERPGPVLGARPRRRLPRPAGPLRAQLRRARRALPAARGDLRPVRARRARLAEHRAPGSDLAHVGDVFSDETNPERKKPFDIRSVMRAAIDRDHPPLERWAGMHEAEIAVVWDAHLGGWPVALIGIESRPLLRHGPIPADGPEQWTSGTLFPRAAKKIARAINAASGRRPVVVLANLAGFDGSPESMREWQLEYGAEIGRAVVNFDGPIVFCVVSRYHGGAFVVFSQKLNPSLETVALEGAHASVIGGAPAAAVVFARDVEQAARRDERIATLDERIAGAEGAERQRLRTERAALWDDVLAEKRGEFAAEFDAAHSVERAVRMGSVSRIVAPASLRPFLIEAVERGMQRALEGLTTDGHARVADPLPR